MSAFFYYQITGGEEHWHEALAESRPKIIAEKRPRFITVLDVSALVSPAMTAGELSNLRYRGPLYFDWDGTDIETCLVKFRQFLDKLREHEVDLNSVRLFATGGRGFHAELPMDLFLSKFPKAGVQHLPAVYKEMCHELYVDTMDLRVYSARKGRMWRTPNVVRENGKFKVPLSVDEAMNMTAADYGVLCSTERSAPPLSPPVFNQKLGVMYAKALQTVTTAMSKRKDAAKDLALLARFKGDYPPSLLKVMQGEGTADVGFHRVAMQITITSNALGKKEEEMLALCAPLIANHQSDGNRYNTPAKRSAELSRMYRYTQDNVCYTYNRDAVRSIVPPGSTSTDLDGLSESAGAVTSVAEDDENGLRGGVFLTDTGIFRKTEDGVLQISDISFKDVTMLADAYTQHRIGFEAEVMVGGRSVGRRLIEQQTFLSRQNFQKFAMQYMGGLTGNDNQVVATSLILRDMAMSNGGMVYLVSREGLDLIQRPDVNEETLDFMWVSPTGVETNSPVQYQHRGSPTISGIYKSDLMTAPQLQGDELTGSVIESMLNVNIPFVIGNVLGWMVSCFHRQVYHHLFNQFPLIQLFGAAGCGKTTTIKDFLFMHYHLHQPIIKNADGDTKFAIEGAMMSSASIPCVLDEYKPAEMKQTRHSLLKSIFRSAYNAASFSKGGMSTELGTTWRDIRSASYSAPIVFIGETLEAETAIRERTLSIPVQKAYLEGRRDAHRHLVQNRGVISSFGRECARATFALNFEAFREQVISNETEVGKMAFKRNNDRPVFNLAVAMTGLDFGNRVLRQHFGDRFDAKFAELKGALLDTSLQVGTSVMPEASKALNALALMSRTEKNDSELALVIGEDYAFESDGGVLDLKPRNCFVKYVAWCRRKGMTPFYDNEDAFMHGLANYGPLMTKSPMDGFLKSDAPMERVFRFDVVKLGEEGVEPFKP